MATKSSAVLNPQLEMTKQTTVHTNLKQEIVCTTKDKMKLRLQEYRDAVETKQKVATWGGITFALMWLPSIKTALGDRYPASATSSRIHAKTRSTVSAVNR